jgi:Flp pilus assembly protein CpaB
MLEMRRVPTVAVCTVDFLAGGRMQAESLRMPEVPIITVPQEYITHAPDAVRALAEARVEEVAKLFLAA